MPVIHHLKTQKTNKEAIQSPEEGYRLIAEFAYNWEYWLNTELNFLYCTPSCERLTGYTPEEFMHHPGLLHQIVHPDDRTIFEKHYQAVSDRTAAPPVEFRIIKRDGQIVWIGHVCQSVTNAQGPALGRRASNRDITARKQSETALSTSLEKLRQAMNGIIQAIALTVETRDPYIAGHQRRVADLGRAIAQEMGLSSDQVDGLRLAGIIHDLGKISIPAEILSKPARLTELEMALVRTHPQVGYDILKEIEFPWPVARMVLEHHERINGSGYPAGLTGGQMLPESRILAVADVVEAIASFRPYRPALGIDPALEEISGQRGSLYDPPVVEACVHLFKAKGYALKQVSVFK